ncbi:MULTISPECIES: hypothetical protein [Brevibacillus]|uniref:Lipoprotein n=1 Tax=Brevibacillus aydinogluensis TaxID=927786 RepID=A0AA48RIB9_9BACL|nr:MULTISPECIES: hypothetical protein [Brevibacillus]NNV03739.1 hypothetical protein [Brevibacillus sp. MCWH]REK63413.1 MAG: hypothetical protein DF221_11020 [Brevibacillus sp.]CAJ1003622.1 Lipoprotein [Brevibacillus aydinogluensis]
MRKPILLTFLFILVVCGVYLIVDRMTYTSFADIVEDQIQPNDEVTIRMERYSDDATTKIVDQDKVKNILAALSTLRLQKVNDFTSRGAYAIRLYVNGSYRFGMELLEDHNYIRISHDKRVNVYKIVNDVDPLTVLKMHQLEFHTLDQKTSQP